MLARVGTVIPIGPEQVETRISEAAQVARLQRGTGDDERAAERALVAGLAVAVVRHVLRAGGAHVVLDVLGRLTIYDLQSDSRQDSDPTFRLALRISPEAANHFAILRDACGT